MSLTDDATTYRRPEVRDRPAHPMATSAAVARIRDLSTRQMRVIEVHGEIDLAAAGPLRDALMRHVTPRRTVVLDAAGVTFIDSIGVAALVAVSRAARAVGGSLEVHSAPGRSALRILELTGTSGLFDLKRDGR